MLLVEAHRNGSTVSQNHGSSRLMLLLYDSFACDLAISVVRVAQVASDTIALYAIAMVG